MIKANIGEIERFEFFYSQSGVLNNTFLPLGQTGKTMFVNIRRANGDWWTGSAWQASIFNIAMVEKDATNEPGYYYYDYTWVTVGKYSITIKDGTTPVNVSLTENYDCIDNFQAYADDTVYVDATLGIAGSTYPKGTATQPSNNMTNALAIANTYKLKNIKIAGSVAMVVSGMNSKSYSGRGVPYLVDQFTGPVDISSCSFKNMTIGTFYGGVAAVNSYFYNCFLGYPRVTGCILDHCVLSGLMPYVSGITVFDCEFLTGYNILPDTFSGSLDINNSYGKINIVNLVGGTINISGFRGKVSIEASCTAGIINIIGGDGQIVNTTGGATVNISGFYPNTVPTGMALEATVNTRLAATSYVAPDNVSTLFSANMDKYSIEYDFSTYAKSIMKFYDQDRPFVGNADYWCYVYKKDGTKPLDFTEIAKRDRVKPWSTPPV